MAVSLKTDLRFPESGQHGHGSRIIQIIISKDLAELNHLKVGDQLAVTNTKGNKIEITIVGIFQQKEVESIEEKVTFI